MQAAKGARVKDLGDKEAKGQVVKYACASVKCGRMMDHERQLQAEKATARTTA
jgi:hypothetical protein